MTFRLSKNPLLTAVKNHAALLPLHSTNMLWSARTTRLCTSITRTVSAPVIWYGTLLADICKTVSWATPSGVVVPGEVGILLIYAPIFLLIFLTAQQRPVHKE